MKSRKYILFFACVLIFCGWGIYTWINHDPLAKYGVSYKKETGEDAILQSIYFYWDRNKQRIDGPMVAGDDISVSYKYADGNDVPEILISSSLYAYEHAVLKLNFTDPNKPEFELVERNGPIGVHYPSPWDKYYKKDPETPIHILLFK